MGIFYAKTTGFGTKPKKSRQKNSTAEFETICEHFQPQSKRHRGSTHGGRNSADESEHKGLLNDRELGSEASFDDDPYYRLKYRNVPA